MNQSSGISASKTHSDGMDPPKPSSPASSSNSQCPWSNNVTSTTSTILSWRPSVSRQSSQVRNSVSALSGAGAGVAGTIKAGDRHGSSAASFVLIGDVPADVTSSPTGSTGSHLRSSSWSPLRYKASLDLSSNGPSAVDRRTSPVAALSPASRPNKMVVHNFLQPSSVVFPSSTSDKTSSSIRPSNLHDQSSPSQWRPSRQSSPSEHRRPGAQSYHTSFPPCEQSFQRAESDSGWVSPELSTFPRQSLLSDNPGSPPSDAGWPPVLSSPRLVREPQAHLDPSSGICTSPQLAPQLNPNASTFVPGHSQSITIKSVDGTVMDLDVLRRKGSWLSRSTESDSTTSSFVAGSWEQSNIWTDSMAAKTKLVGGVDSLMTASEKGTILRQERIRKEQGVREWTSKEAKEARLQEEERMKAEAEWRLSVEAYDDARKEWEATVTGPGSDSSWDNLKEKLQIAASSSTAPFRADLVDKFRKKVGGEWAASRPRSLASMPIIKDVNQVTYPEGIKGPDKELNAYAQDSKFIYDREFLIQFMSVCTEDLAAITPLDIIDPTLLNRSSTVSRGSLGRLGRISKRLYTYGG